MRVYRSLDEAKRNGFEFWDEPKNEKYYVVRAHTTHGWAMALALKESRYV